MRTFDVTLVSGARCIVCASAIYLPSFASGNRWEFVDVHDGVIWSYDVHDVKQVYEGAKLISTQGVVKKFFLALLGFLFYKRPCPYCDGTGNDQDGLLCVYCAGDGKF